MKTHVFARQSSTFTRHRDRSRVNTRRAWTRLVIFLKHSLRLLKFGRRERQSRIFVLAHLFQTFRVLPHLFQQVLLLLIVRIRAFFKLLEPRSILLKRFSRYDGVVSLETHASRRSNAVVRAGSNDATRDKNDSIARAVLRARRLAYPVAPRIHQNSSRALESSNSRYRARTSAAACPPVHPVITRARERSDSFFRCASTRARRALGVAARARRHVVSMRVRFCVASWARAGQKRKKGSRCD